MGNNRKKNKQFLIAAVLLGTMTDVKGQHLPDSYSSIAVTPSEIVTRFDEEQE